MSRVYAFSGEMRKGLNWTVWKQQTSSYVSVRHLLLGETEERASVLRQRLDPGLAGQVCAPWQQVCWGPVQIVDTWSKMRPFHICTDSYTASYLWGTLNAWPRCGCHTGSHEVDVSSPFLVT